MKKTNELHHEENHKIHRSGGLRAAVLGANDGIVSISSIIVGVAASGALKMDIILAGSAGLIAGACAMAAGEYVSVKSQEDTENADLAMEKEALEKFPEEELLELAAIYEKRGLDPNLALEVAKQMTAHNALEAHARDEIGITTNFARPRKRNPRKRQNKRHEKPNPFKSKLVQRKPEPRNDKPVPSYMRSTAATRLWKDSTAAEKRKPKSKRTEIY